MFSPLLPLFLIIGLLFGALAAAAGYVISLDEYRKRRLRPGQSAAKMALSTAVVTFLFFFLGAIALSFILRPPNT